MFRTALLAMTLVCGMATFAFGVPIITAGDWLFNTQTVGNRIPIMISDDGQGPSIAGLAPGYISSISLVLFVGGGPGGPTITDVDLTGPGTIFHANNTGQNIVSDPYGLPGRETLVFTSSASPGGVNANGILAFVTFTTVGAADAIFPFALSSPDLGGTDVGDFDNLPILIDGTVIGQPEPSSIVMGLMGAAALGVVVIRKRRARG